MHIYRVRYRGIILDVNWYTFGPLAGAAGAAGPCGAQNTGAACGGHALGPVVNGGAVMLCGAQTL